MTDYRKLWEREHGLIPEGHEIHHIDGDRTNNSIENLKALSIRDHYDLSEQERLRLREEASVRAREIGSRPKSAQHRASLSAARRKKLLQQGGYSKETLEAMSRGQKQRFATQPHPRKGTHHTEETKRILREKRLALLATGWRSRKSTS